MTGAELISKAAALEAARKVDSYAWSDFASVVEGLPAFDPIKELDRRYPGYGVLPRDCIERTLSAQPAAAWIEMPGYTDDRGRPRRDFGCSNCHCKWTTPEDREPPETCPFCGAAME